MLRPGFVVVSVAAALALAGCSTMPEWTKPSAWIDGVSGSSDPEQKGSAKAEQKDGAQAPAVASGSAATTPAAAPAAGSAANDVYDPLAPEPEKPRIGKSDKPTEFPNVNSQPAAREAVTTEAQRREIRDSLVADRDNAQHTADELRGGAAPAAAPPAPATAPKTATQPDASGKNPPKP